MRLKTAYSFLDGTNIQLESDIIIDHPTFSFADAVQHRLDITEARLTNMSKLRRVVKLMKAHVQDEDQDWVFMVCGYVGHGKSNLAMNLAIMIDPEFDIDTQMVNSFDEDYSFIDYTEKYMDVKYKAVLFDEAIVALFSKDSPTYSSKSITKLFNMNRQLNHYYILTVPDFWSIEKYTREQRTRSMLYVFPDRNTRRRLYAYYSRDKITKLTSNPGLRSVFSSSRKFLKAFPPDFIEPFPMMPLKYRNKYQKRKKGGLKDFFGELKASADIHKRKKSVELKKLLGDDIDETDI